MRGESHRCLGRYLLENYMPQLPKPYASAFLLGCIEPDRNPATYLKGSVRYQWLRGHNYWNARHFMERLAARLERKENLGLLDYYALGKLIHYTVDAFTYAHNFSFPQEMASHIAYEHDLQLHFLSFLQENPPCYGKDGGSIMAILSALHHRYERKPGNLQRDSKYSLVACCSVMSQLFPQPV